METVTGMSLLAADQVSLQYVKNYGRRLPQKCSDRQANHLLAPIYIHGQMLVAGV